MVLRKQESGSNRNQGLREGREVTHTPATALHSHLLARRGPPSGGNPQAHSQGAFTLLLIFLSWVPARPPITKAPSSPGVLTLAPSLLASHPPGPHMREGQAECPSKGQSTQHGGGAGRRGRETRFLLNFLPPSFPSLPSFHPIHPSLHFFGGVAVHFLFLSRYFLRVFFFPLILYFTDITRIVYSCFLLSACRTYRITHTHPCSWGEVLAGSAPPPPQRGDWTGDRGHLGRPEPRLLPPRLTHPDPHHTQS